MVTLAIVYFVRRIRAAKRAKLQLDSPQISSSFTAPLLSVTRPVSSWSQYSYVASPELDSSSSYESHTSSSLSPSSEGFHFPILSADGHLLPPAPASVGRAAPDGDLGNRPLPLSPADCHAHQISPPTSQWSQHTKHGYFPVVGLYPEDQYGLPLAQRATVYRSFSAEGEEITDGDVTDLRGR